MEGLAHYDDPTAGWPDPEHTTLQQAVAALAAAAAAQDPHDLHHHHAFADLTSNNGPDISRAPGNVGHHSNHAVDNDAHNITLAGAAAAAGGMNIPLSSLDLPSHQHLPPFPSHHLGSSTFSLSGSTPQHILPSPEQLNSAQSAVDAAAAAQAKKQEKKERKRREKAELKRQADEQARFSALGANGQNGSINVGLSNAVSVGQHASTNIQGSSQIPLSANVGTMFGMVNNSDPSDAIVRRRGNGDDEGPITDVNEWLAGSWLKGVNLTVHLRKGKFTSQEEKLVDDAVSDYLAARGLTREHDLTRMLFGEGDIGGGDGDIDNGGAGGSTAQKTRAKNRERVELVKAIAPNIPGRPLTSINAFIVRKYDPYVRKGPWTAQEDADLLTAYQQYGPSWDKISRIVERNETDCRVRYTNHLQIKHTRKRGLWSPEEEDTLQRTIAEVCAASRIPIKETPNRPISWSTVVQKMAGQRNALECREKWFDQILPRLIAREDAVLADSQVASIAAPTQSESSTPAVPVIDSSSSIKTPRASEWTQADFINLLRRIAQVYGPDLTQTFQRDINFRILHASTPELAKFSYKHCYKTFRAYAKRIEGFETLPLGELLPKLEGIVTSKFRSGGPRSGSAPLRRPRATPVERIRKESKSQEHVDDDDSDSDPSGTSDSEGPRAEHHVDSPLVKVDMPAEAPTDTVPQDDMIDPALLALGEHESIPIPVQESFEDPADATATAHGTDTPAEPFAADNTIDAEQVDFDQPAMESEGKKRKHDEGGETKPSKKSKKDKGKHKAEDATQGSPVGDESSPSTDSAEMDIDLADFGLPSDITLASEAAKESLISAELPVETEEEKRKRKEEKRKRKEERRARKEAKRLEQEQQEQIDMLVADSHVA